MYLILTRYMYLPGFVLVLLRYIPYYCMPKTDAGIILGEMFEGFYNNFFSKIVKLRPSKKEEQQEWENTEGKRLRDEFKDGVLQFVDPIEKLLAKQKFVCGEELTYADFMVYTMALMRNNVTANKVSDSCPAITAHTEELMKNEGFKNWTSENKLGMPA